MSEITSTERQSRSTDGLSTRRRNPLQSRSQATVRRILRAASQLLAAASVEEITTSRIARKAGISVGALYRFFPEKQSIIDAIAVRHMEEFQAEFEGRFATLNLQDGPAFLGAVIDAFVAFLDARPDFRAIAFGPHISASTRRRQSDPDAVGAGLVKNFMIARLGMKDLSALDLRLRVAIETGERIFAFAYEHNDAEERARIIAELKTLLSGYLFGA
ncbi:MAG TPA: TetR/AcrR family transcriptional regulator [Candidatus Acidoferrum sp.]|nr:TetR/AcrR family transcriptional regulator [Candidatus Acidoferrum sp.]